MIKQFNFLSIIFRDIGQANYLYAADILYQLYKKEAALSIDDFIAFFRHRNQLVVWETIMLLTDFKYLTKYDSCLTSKYLITKKGLEKIHIILACLKWCVWQESNL